MVSLLQARLWCHSLRIHTLSATGAVGLFSGRTRLLIRRRRDTSNHQLLLHKDSKPSCIPPLSSHSRAAFARAQRYLPHLQIQPSEECRVSSIFIYLCLRYIHITGVGPRPFLPHQFTYFPNSPFSGRLHRRFSTSPPPKSNQTDTPPVTEQSRHGRREDRSLSSYRSYLEHRNSTEPRRIFTTSGTFGAFDDSVNSGRHPRHSALFVSLLPRSSMLKPDGQTHHGKQSLCFPQLSNKPSCGVAMSKRSASMLWPE